VRLCDLAREAIAGALNALPWDEGPQVQVRVTPSPVRVTPKQAHTLALVFNELATNTIKYGLRDHNEGQIHVRISQGDGWVTFVYRDDGPGYPQPVLKGTQHDEGLYLLARLTKSLRGDIIMENKGGAVTRVQIPLKE
jgi:two-component sensor histidine kinase